MKPLWSLLFVGSKRVSVKLPAMSSPAVSPASDPAREVYSPPSNAVLRKFGVPHQLDAAVHCVPSELHESGRLEALGVALVQLVHAEAAELLVGETPAHR